MMLAHYHGQIFPASEIGRSLAVADTTARHYVDVLADTFVVRQLQPWWYNTKKRLVKRPKVYMRDSGLLHALFSAETEEETLSHPQLGASWEGFAVEQAIRHFQLAAGDVFFWAVHTGAELDVVFTRHRRLWGVEATYTETPTVTSSMRAALSELSLTHLWVLYPGEVNYDLAPRISAVAIRRLPSLCLPPEP